MGKLIDITGHVFGEWKVLERDLSKKGTNGTYWICENLNNDKIKSISKSGLLRFEKNNLNNLNKKWLVYKHTSPSNRSYIGITGKSNPNQRWGKNGNNYLKSKCHKKFNKAINKYGWENFTHEVLERELDYQKARSLEKYYIKLYNSYNRGYNMTLGGEHSPMLGKHHTEEYKLYMSTILKGRIPSEETRKKMKENHVDYSGINHPRYGKKLSEETKQKIRKSSIGKIGMSGNKNPNFGRIRGLNYNAKKVMCNGIIFDCESDCANYYNLSVGTISSYLNGSKPMSPKFMKLNLRFVGDNKTYKMTEKNKIIVADKKIFYIANDCAKYLSLDLSSMRKYLNGKYPMPQKWIDRGLRYYNPETDKDLPIYVDTKNEV